jgi:DNA-binding response OmpR family regulator
MSDVPVIVLSAIADQMRLDDLETYANVSKPFDPDQLVQVVRGRVRRAAAGPICLI